MVKLVWVLALFGYLVDQKWHVVTTNKEHLPGLPTIGWEVTLYSQWVT